MNFKELFTRIIAIFVREIHQWIPAAANVTILIRNGDQHVVASEDSPRTLAELFMKLALDNAPDDYVVHYLPTVN